MVTRLERADACDGMRATVNLLLGSFMNSDT